VPGLHPEDEDAYGAAAHAVRHAARDVLVDPPFSEAAADPHQPPLRLRLRLVLAVGVTAVHGRSLLWNRAQDFRTSLARAAGDPAEDHGGRISLRAVGPIARCQELAGVLLSRSTRLFAGQTGLLCGES